TIREDIPGRVSVDIAPADSQLLEEWLSEKRGKKVQIFVPKQGEGLKLMQLARENASEKLSKYTGKNEKQQRVLEDLRNTLGLTNAPAYIEAYDISHTAGSETVGGMIVFKDGKPHKKSYRKFAVRGIENDDCAAMAQVLSRRMDEYLKAADKSDGFGRLPDLILLDGSKGEINAVHAVLCEKGISVPLFGMVKDGRHRTRAIATSGDEISIQEKRAVFTLIADIQEEVHRFAITYHRQKRKKNTLSSNLTQIEGIGEKRAKALLQHFGTLTAIQNADLASLEAVNGISKPAAEAVYRYFHKKEDD
ncbi:MAG: excinuclease ABC subunit UvrC, partial [Oscillospiraceae bacterium]|nr:excinuclease ABC subunit UvrC [Oscillospiraceae bacterium]